MCCLCVLVVLRVVVPVCVDVRVCCWLYSVLLSVWVAVVCVCCCVWLPLFVFGVVYD